MFLFPSLIKYVSQGRKWSFISFESRGEKFAFNSSDHDVHENFQLFINMPGLQLQFP